MVIADLDERAGPATATRIGGSFVRADVASETDLRLAVEGAGQVGVLVNNAGGIEEPCFPAADRAKWEHTLDLNLRASCSRGIIGPGRPR